MNADVIRPLLRIKTLRADRAEEEYRRRRAVYNATLAAIDTAKHTLEDWRADMPRKETAIYDEVLGRVVDLETLDAVKERVVQLREHERLLDKRMRDAQEAAREAGKAADEGRRSVGTGAPRRKQVRGDRRHVAPCQPGGGGAQRGSRTRGIRQGVGLRCRG
ncbi:MAG: YscO family type III secretion system apparatus protein [Acetobacteraceae bacterium]